MGLGKDEYPKFRDMNQRSSRRPMDEINGVSDFRVTVDYQRQGRKMTALKFKMRRVELLPEPPDAQAKLFPGAGRHARRAVKELKEAGV